MAHDAPASTLGRCPACGEELDRGQLVVRYLQTDQTTKLLAICPVCEELVQPVGQRGDDDHRS